MIAHVLLVSADARVISSVRQAVHSVANCQLDVVGSCDSLPEAGSNGPQAVFCHLTLPGAESQILAMLAKASKSGKAPPVITISDHYDPTQAMQLLSQGAADYLGRPLNLGRIAMLTDILTAKRRLR